MTNTQTIFLFLFSFLGFTSLHSQTAVELLRYTDVRSGGTARTIGIGGAISALGADYASLSSNPAGVAAYRKSEFVLSLGQLNTNFEATLDGSEPVIEKKGNFNLEALGFVFHNSPRRKPNWKAFNMSFGINRLASFHRVMNYTGTGNSSILESFAESANGFSTDELSSFDTQMAFELEAIVEDPSNPGSWFTFDDFSLGSIERNETLTVSGGINELVFSLGGNYKDKLLVGLTIGAPMFRYEQVRSYSETDPNANIPEFENLTFSESLTTAGFGINVKAGLIYRVSPKIRFGVSIHSPTSYGLTDNFSSRLQYTFVNGEGTPDAATISDNRESDAGTFDYALKAPWRLAGGMAVVMNKIGFLTAELEYLDYTSGSFNLTKNRSNTQIEIDQNNLNDEIDESFTAVLNLKVGGEFALKKWRLRAGYALNPTAFADESEKDDFLSFGLGFRGENFYLDGALRHSISNQSYLPYTVSEGIPQPLVDNKIVQNRIILTFGYRF